MGAGNHPRTRKGRERGPRHGGKGHHGRHHNPHPGRAHHDGGTSAAPAPQNTPTHTTEVRAGTRRDRTPEATPHGGRKPPKNQEGAGAGTTTRRKRAPRQTPRPTPREGTPRRGDQRRPSPTKHPNTHHRSKHRTPCGSHQRTPTGHRKPHGEWRAHLHGENGPHPQRKPQETPPHGAPPRPHRQATTPATTRRPHKHRKRTKARPRHRRLGTETPRGHGTKAQAPRKGNPTDRHATTLLAMRPGLCYRRGSTQSIAMHLD